MKKIIEKLKFWKWFRSEKPNMSIEMILESAHIEIGENITMDNKPKFWGNPSSNNKRIERLTYLVSGKGLKGKDMDFNDDFFGPIFWFVCTMCGGIVAGICLFIAIIASVYAITSDTFVMPTMGLWYYSFGWIIAHMIPAVWAWRLDVADWRRGYVANSNGVSDEIRVTSAIKTMIDRAREKVLGTSSDIAHSREEIREKTNKLAEKRAHFEERIRHGATEIAEKALEKITLAEGKLSAYREYVGKVEAGFVRAFATCEARIPRISDAVKDSTMIAELDALTDSIEGVGERVANLYPSAMKLIMTEFGRINQVLDGVTNKAMALPMPDLTGDDIQSVVARLTEGQVLLDQEICALEATLMGENVTA